MKTEEEFLQLTDAEDYFAFFDVAYDRNVLGAKRLHILRRYGELLNEMGKECAALCWEERWPVYREALIRAYRELQMRTPQEAGLFSVFKDAQAGTGCAGCSQMCSTSSVNACYR
ncbi:nitrogenase stabilizing/protective protein [Kyrpidia spormannii]|uniref:Nitrogenase stabilizing/protective protein n=1 Tax=Kyrpidia spormannii TaxID=2055160 RepID=A0A2K8N7V5_9BACL|nr:MULTISPECIES: nitrogenase-stabilizing/protective protein NifW [Kyrpidia]ATY84897.1 nitrogenase stabilizing/protective protein [Kyrpidia spormannii]MCL6574621.1 nitrogenase-stabilizing/protective protein NifW [Kyrpidia sp.]